MNTSLGDGVALKPYIAQINKLSSDSAVSNLIPTVLSDSNVFVFGELFQLEKIQALARGEYKKTFDLLHIFAYGRYSDYLAQEANLAKLTAKQATKLRQLTVVSLAAETRVIPYSKLLAELGLSSTRECEDLIIDALYKGILTGKLDSGTKQFAVESAIGRDIKPQDLDNLLSVLARWEKESKDLIVAIEAKLKYANEEHAKIVKMKEDHVKRLEDTKASVKMIMENEIEGQAGGMMSMMTGIMGGMGGMGMGMGMGMGGMGMGMGGMGMGGMGMGMHGMGMDFGDDRKRGKDKKSKRLGMM